MVSLFKHTLHWSETIKPVMKLLSELLRSITPPQTRCWCDIACRKAGYHCPRVITLTGLRRMPTFTDLIFRKKIWPPSMIWIKAGLVLLYRQSIITEDFGNIRAMSAGICEALSERARSHQGLSKRNELTACKVDLEGFASGLEEVIQAKRWRIKVLSTTLPVPSDTKEPRGHLAAVFRYLLSFIAYPCRQRRGII